jgi:hypothetical protein
MVFLVLLAAAGLFAVLVFTGAPRLEAQDSERTAKATEVVEIVLFAAPRASWIVVLVDSEERARILRSWRDTKPILDANSFNTVEFSGPIPPAALEEALVFASVTCALEGCAEPSVLDLRGADGGESQ